MFDFYYYISPENYLVSDISNIFTHFILQVLNNFDFFYFIHFICYLNYINNDRHFKVSFIFNFNFIKLYRRLIFLICLYLNNNYYYLIYFRWIKTYIYVFLLSIARFIGFCINRKLVADQMLPIIYRRKRFQTRQLLSIERGKERN